MKWNLFFLGKVTFVIISGWRRVCGTGWLSVRGWRNGGLCYFWTNSGQDAQVQVSQSYLKNTNYSENSSYFISPKRVLSVCIRDKSVDQ